MTSLRWRPASCRPATCRAWRPCRRRGSRVIFPDNYSCCKTEHRPAGRARVAARPAPSAGAARVEHVVTNNEMVLSGGLSNHPFKDLLQCLTSHKTRQDRTLQTKTPSGWPDGRRRFGTVSSAIVDAMAHGQEMSVKAIRVSVEERLGGRVSRFSVSDYLLTRSRSPKPLFVRTRYGHYRLLR